MVRIEIGGTKDGITLLNTNSYEAVCDLWVAAEYAIRTVRDTLYECKKENIKAEIVDEHFKEMFTGMYNSLVEDGYLY